MGIQLEMPYLSSPEEMRFKTRYRFWHVLLVVVCLCILGMTISYFMSVPAGNDGVKEITETGSVPNKNYIRLPFFFAYLSVFFYFSLNYYYNLVAGNKKIISFLKVTFIIILVSVAYYIFLFYFLPEAPLNKYSSLSQMLFIMMGSLVPMLIVSFLFAYVTVLRESLKQKRVLEAQKLLLEAQVSQANFNFLKAQINPHFLHNTLNFLYAKSLPYSSELSEGILTLSDIMRYALSQGNQKDGKAPLKDEIEHVSNVIKINQLRYRNKLKVNVEINGSVNGVMIIPFILITLVENAFKHGDLKNQDYPIDIRLNVEGNKLSFYCRNKKKTGPKQLTTGIGLDNIKKRLEIAYGDEYDFIVKDEPEFYTTELTIYEI
ncbi:MAG TPA: histidine kinase [Ferruginibacter sp.]|nr:histidine kinase [Ferruginibacter sp.]